MALASGSLFNVTATATTANVNGAGFNPANAAFPTDLAATVATGNSPVVTSATYTFVAGDVGAAVYVKTGTNWTAGFYPIASVSAGAATLSAAVGQAWQLSATTGMYALNTVAGCATVASPTGGTYGVNYAMQDTAIVNGVADFTAVGASTTLTSATAAFTPVMVGNIFHQTTTGTGAFGVVGWYEVVSYTNATTVVLDRTPNSGTTSVACTGYVGGAGRLNALEGTFQGMIPASSMVWIKNGTYTLTGAMTTANANATSILQSFWIGYNSVVGDACNGANRPIIAAAANGVTIAAGTSIRNLIINITTAAGVTISASGGVRNCKIFNSSTGTGRAGLTLNACTVVDCEVISQNGNAMTSTNFSALSGSFLGNYIHDSVTGISIDNATTTTAIVVGNIFEACSTQAIIMGSSHNRILNNTFYGREAKMGTGLNFNVANSTPNEVFNNIFYGLTTGITVLTGSAGRNADYYNDFFNNTTDVTNWNKDATDLAVNPTFTGATQLTGTGGTATGGTSVITDSGADFSTVTDNVDFVRITAATGGVGTIIANYLITSHTGTTLTVNNTIGTSGSITAINYFVTTGHNFQIGTNLKAAGFPSFTNVGSETTSYPDVGAVQRQEAGGSGGMLFIPCLQGL
jgi:hypothetical protein